MKTNKIKSFRIRSPFLPALLLVATLAGLSGCTRDAEEIDPTGSMYGDEVIITVQIPETQVPTTRSIAGANGEAKVSTIDVLVFRDSPEVLAEHAVGTIITQSTSADNKYEVRFRAKLTASSSASTIAIVANAATEINEAMELASGLGARKSTFLSSLYHASSNPNSWNPNGWKWNTASSSNCDYIPMYGEVTSASGIAYGTKIEDVALTRMLARIDIINGVPLDFTLSRVHVVNYNTAGYIAPAWDANGKLQSTLPSSPMIPDINEPQKGDYDAMTYTYIHNGGEGMLGEIYTYEAEAATEIEGTNHDEDACLILEGLYAGKTYFYRVDFNTGEDSKNYMPLYRNHRYTVTITAAEGIGHTSMAAALKSFGVINNLKTQLLVVDESGITNMVFNGQYYLGISNDNLVFPYGGNATAEVKYATNYPVGCVVDNIEYISGRSNWLSTSVSATDIQITAALDNPTGVIREAYIHLKAGRLTHKLKVTQRAAPSLEIEDFYIEFKNIKEPYYPLNAGTYTFNVVCNTDWRIKSIKETYTNNPDNRTTVLNNLASHNLVIGASGGKNTTTGDVVTFRVIYDYSAYMGDISVEFESFDNSFTPKTAILSVKGNIWARSNVVFDGEKLTFAVDREDNIAIPANSQGVFFQWGSLVAISPAALSDDNSATYIAGEYPNGHVVYSPKEISSFTWTSLPYLADKTTPPFNDNDSFSDDFADYNNGKGYNIEAMNGDVCRYISDQGWIKGTARWRMPTGQDLDGLDLGTSFGGNNWTSSNINVTPTGTTYNYGYYQYKTGRLYGLYTTNSDDIENPQNGIYFPAVGYRTSNGEAKEAGYKGYYWTGASYISGTAEVARNMVVQTGTRVTSFAGRPTAAAIRCIRED